MTKIYQGREITTEKLPIRQWLLVGTCVFLIFIISVDVPILADSSTNLTEKKPSWERWVDETPEAVAISSDGKYAFVGTSNGILFLLNSSDPDPYLWAPFVGGKPITCLAVAGDRVAVAFGNTVSIYKVTEDSRLSLLDSETIDPDATYHREVYSLSFSSDGKLLSIGTLAISNSSVIGSSYVYLFNVTDYEVKQIWNQIISESLNLNDAVSVQISANGNFAVAGSAYNTTKNVFLFNKTSNVPQSYKVDGSVNSVSISDDGLFFAVGGDDLNYFGTNGQLWHRKLNDKVSSVSISSNGKYIAAASVKNLTLMEDNNSSLWSYVFADEVKEVSYSSNGYITSRSGNFFYFFSISDDGDPSSAAHEPLWSYDTGAAVESMYTSADGRYSLAGTGTGTEGRVYFFDTKSNPDFYLEAVTVSRGSVTEGEEASIKATIENIGNANALSVSVRLSDNGTQFAETSTSLSEGERKDLMFDVTLFPSGPHNIAVEVDPQNLIYESNETNNNGSVDIIVYPYQPLPKNINPVNTAVTGTVNSVAFSSDGKYIVAGTSDGNVYMLLWNREKCIWKNTIGGSVNLVSISPNGKYIAAAQGNSFQIFTIAHSKPLGSFSIPKIYSATYLGINSLSFSDDGRYLAVGTSSSYYRENSYVYLFEITDTSFQLLWGRNITRQGVDYVSVQVSASGDYILAGSYGNTTENVFLFKNDGSFPLVVGGPWLPTYVGSRANTVTISDDGSYFAVGAENGFVYYFDWERGAAAYKRYNLTASVKSVSMSADGIWMMAANGTSACLLNNNGSIVWMYNTGGYVYTSLVSSNAECLAMRSGRNIFTFSMSNLSAPRFTCDTGYTVNSIALSSNGTYLTVGSGGKIFYFDVSRRLNEAPPTVTLYQPGSSDITSNSVKLRWSQSNARDSLRALEEDFKRYEIYVSKNSSEIGVLTKIIERKNETSHTVQSLSSSTTYIFRIRVIDTEDAWSSFSNVTVTTVPGSRPPSVTLYNPTDIKSRSLKLSWSQSNAYDFHRYEVYKSNNSITVLYSNLTSSYNLLNLVANITENPANTSVFVMDLRNETTYHFVVRVVDTENLSSYSNPNYATTASWIPHAVELNLPSSSDITSNSVRISWKSRNNDPDFKQYEIYYSQSQNPGLGSSYTIEATQSSTSRTIYGLSSGKTYYFRVAVLDTEGQRAFSSQVNATTSASSLSSPSQGPNYLEILGYGILGLFLIGIVAAVIRKVRSGKKPSLPPSKPRPPPKPPTRKRIGDLPQRCKNCGFINRQGQMYCGKCGASLTGEDETKIY